MELDTAEAVSLAEGGAFTIYIGDYEIPTDGIATATVDPPDGAHQATIYLTPLGSPPDDSPITEGTTVVYSTEPDTLTISAILFDGEVMHNEAVDGTGELTVDSITDEEICVTLDYSDAQKQVRGTIGATTHSGPF